MTNQKEGLGDKVESIIETIMPKTAAKVKEKGCNCNKRKEWLNNVGAIFG